MTTVLSTSEQSVGSQSRLCSHSKDLEVVSLSAMLKYSKPEGGSSVALTRQLFHGNESIVIEL